MTSAKDEKKRVSVSSEVIIHKSRAEVWRTLYENYGDVAAFHPKVESSTCTAGGTKGALGTQRVCSMNTKGSVYIKESIVSVDEGKSFKIKMDESKGVPFAEAYATYRLSDVGTEKTKVVQEISYRTKPAFMGTLMKGKIGTDLGTVIIGLKYYLETGKQVNASNAASVIKAYRSLASGAAFA